MKYLVYKILNFIFIVNFKKFQICNIVFSNKPINIGNSSKILFDFSHSSTHLGDRLFFFPLIYNLYNSGIEIHISENDLITESLFKKLDNSLEFTKEFNKKNIDLVIVPAPSLLALYSEYKYLNLVICDFLKVNERNIEDELNIGMSPLIKSVMPFRAAINLTKICDEFLNIDNKYYIFSNYIDSGWFRKYFVNVNALEKKAVYLKNQGYKILHVGSEKDLNKDNKKYKFIDQDLRGKLSISELIQLVAKKNIIGAVTYDNFIMHLCGIYDKKTFVLFRGRFSKKNATKHIKYINPLFFNDDNDIKYLK